MVKISIVIPVYNMAQYIPCCLDSLAQQTLKEYEALCVDDGSTDDSVAVVREYAKKDNRVRSIPLGKNMGVFAARNKALECATGEFIAFLDPDDWYPEPDVLEDLYNSAKKNNVLVSGGGWTNHYPDKPPQTEFGGTLWGLGCFKNPGVVDYRDYQFDFGYQRFIFSRKLLQDNRIAFPAYTRYQDPPFFVRAMHAAGKFYGMNRSTYNYRTSYKTVDYSKRDYLKSRDMLKGLADELCFAKESGLEKLHVLAYDRSNNCTGCYSEAIRKNPDAFALACEVDRSFDWTILERNRKQMLSGYHPSLKVLRELTETSEWKAQGPDDPAVIKKAVRYFELHVVDGDIDETRMALYRRIWQSVYGTDRPRVSILVPVYNVADKLRAALDSALAQTLRDIEVICVDDGSSDGSTAILEEYAKRDSRVVVLRHKANKGLYMARKTAILWATGRYVTLLDSDDALFPEACERAVACAEETGADIVHGQTVVNNVMNFPKSRIDWVEKPTRPYVQPLEGRAILLGAFVDRKIGTNVWGKLYTRSLLLKAYASLPDVRITMAEDVMAMYPLAAFARKYVPLAEPFYHYTYGTGITGKSELNLRQFQSQCDGLDILPALRTVRDGALKVNPDRWPAYGALRERILGETFGRIRTFIADKGDQREAMRYFESKLGALDFVKYLAECYFGNRNVPIEFLDRLNYVPQVRKADIRRIGFVYFRLSTGGVQRVMVLLAPLFRKLGYEVVFILEEKLTDTCFPLPSGVEVRYLPESSKCTAKSVGNRLQQLSDIIREDKLDAIYYHEFSSHLLQWDMLVCKLVYKIPFITHFHSCIGTALYAATLTPEFSYLAAKMRLCDKVVTLSRTDDLYLKAQGVRAEYLPNPVAEELKRVELGDLKAKFARKTILWVARISWEKHPVDPIVIFDAVHRKIPDARLVLVGDGLPDVVAAMRRRARELGLENRIAFAGNQTNVYPYYESASVFLMTSSFEGFPLTLLESGMYGLPTVAYRLPFLEAIRDNSGIVQVDQEDTKGAAAALCRVLSDEKVYLSMAHANREHMMRFAQFDQSAAWKRILDELKSSEVKAPCLASVDASEIRMLLEELQYCYTNGFKSRMSKIARLEKELRVVRDSASAACANVPSGGKTLDVLQTAKRVQFLAREVESLKNSEAYRVGMIVTWPLRFLLGKTKRR